MLATSDTNQKKSSFSLFLMYVFLNCIIYTLPYFKFVTPYMISAPLMLVSVFMFLFKKEDWMILTVLLGGLSMFLIVTAALFGGHMMVSAINEGIRNIRFFLPALWALYALKYTKKNQQTLFIVLFLAMTIFILRKTFIALDEFPEIARELAQGKGHSWELDEYRLGNVGGFEFSYMIGVITFCFAELFFRFKNLFLKLAFLLLIVVCFNFIIQTMYTTLLILTFIGVSMLFYLHIKEPFVKVLFLLTALILALFMGNIFLWLSTIFPPESGLVFKFEKLHNAISTNDIYAMGSRPEHMAVALSYWLDNPIFGVFAETNNAHSLIVSTLSNYGLTGLCIYLYLYFSIWRHLSNCLKEMNCDTKLLNVSLTYLFALSFFNPIGYCFEISIAAFFAVPIFTNVIQINNLRSN